MKNKSKEAIDGLLNDPSTFKVNLNSIQSGDSWLAEQEARQLQNWQEQKEMWMNTTTVYTGYSNTLLGSDPTRISTNTTTGNVTFPNNTIEYVSRMGEEIQSVNSMSVRGYLTIEQIIEKYGKEAAIQALGKDSVDKFLAAEFQKELDKVRRMLDE